MPRSQGVGCAFGSRTCNVARRWHIHCCPAGLGGQDERIAMARTSSGGERTATEMLIQDHKRVQRLFKDFEKVDRDDEESVRELVETACLEFQIHSMLEEEIFYPAVRAQAEGDSEDVLNEAEIEHEAADDLIAKLHELEADDPMYCA